jgi:hypothetical protein
MRTKEGGSEWELIKILLEGGGSSNKMNPVGYPKSHAQHTTFRLPRPRSHWSATGPSNKHYQEPQILHTHGSGNNPEAACLEGAVRPGMEGG